VGRALVGGRPHGLVPSWLGCTAPPAAGKGLPAFGNELTGDDTLVEAEDYPPDGEGPSPFLGIGALPGPTGPSRPSAVPRQTLTWIAHPGQRACPVHSCR